ncbi:TetR/AcrR family transcriptional regulator [Litoribacter ruber]|uniref:TetR/AcrR family transcriptional regulator n=1 Tax=Litoribacter ruber TaxID=702568 RepID=A0AAP2CEQ3_9BACT|nr:MULTISPECIES: TetR/AcrR family transcriptional regulator [Litoribacter]MBS9523138.1 TetR/AcrR family transcriptional regulator [Litoribacter alkaliphilus]MBT0810699.1 TetR/AcrR family transcriptional regulator [Litoribacter ruber]
MSKKADIEAKILAEAYKLFLNKGYKNTTMDDIAQGLGMSKKTLYKYFPGKFELLSAAFDLLRSKLSIKVEALISNTHIPFPIKLKSFLTIIAKDLAPINPELLADLREHAPEIWTELQEYIRDSAFLRFQRLIEEGVEKGFIGSHINKTIVVLIYSSAIQNLMDPKFLDQFPDQMMSGLVTKPADIYDQTISIIFEGILTDEARGSFKEA